MRKAENPNAEVEEPSWQELVLGMGDVFYTVDSTGRVTRVSEAVEAIFGLPTSHFAETYEEFFGVDDKQDAKETTRLRILEVPNEEGEMIVFELNERRLARSGQNLYVGIARDLSERERRYRIVARGQKLEALKRMSGGLAHELNDLLTVIGGEADMLVDGPCSESAKIILDTTERAGDLTRRLMLFGGDPSGPKKSLDLSTLVRDALRLFGRMLPERITVDLDLGAMGRIEAPPAELSTVLLNLLSNAADSMPEGGAMRVTTVDLPRNSQFAVQGKEGPCASVALSVEDNGVGMSAQEKARMFDPFYSNKGKSDQYGMGLSVVHGIVSRLGGAVQVYSELGVGTRIDVVLPKVIERKTESFGLSVSSQGRGRLILVVEDDARVRSLTTRVLERSGFQVLGVGVPTEALELDDEVLGKIDLVVSDVVMPRLSGPELYDKLRERRSDLRAIFVSGYAGEALGSEVIEGTSFLRKPWKRDELLAAIERCLSD